MCAKPSKYFYNLKACFWTDGGLTVLKSTCRSYFELNMNEIKDKDLIYPSFYDQWEANQFYCNFMANLDLTPFGLLKFECPIVTAVINNNRVCSLKDKNSKEVDYLSCRTFTTLQFLQGLSRYT